jgi:hypothetical protein
MLIHILLKISRSTNKCEGPLWVVSSLQANRDFLTVSVALRPIAAVHDFHVSDKKPAEAGFLSIVVVIAS